MSTPKRKVNPLSLEEKMAVIREVENSNGRTKSQIAEQFRIPKSTLSTILKEKQRICMLLSDGEDQGSGSSGPQRKRMRMRRGFFPQVEDALLLWIQEQMLNNQTITGQKMMAKSQELASQFGLEDFKCSHGWLDNFKRRHSISYNRTGPGNTDGSWTLPMGSDADGSRPRSNGDLAGSAEGHQVTEEGVSRLLAVLDQFAPRDVFFILEMGLLYDLTPDQLSSTEVRGHQVSFLTATNLDGSHKHTPLVVGEAAPDSRARHVMYHQRPDCRVTQDHFLMFLKDLDTHMVAMNRRVAVICEQNPVHKVPDRFRAIELVRIPACPLTRGQTERGGVLHELKKQYRRRVASWLGELNRRLVHTEGLQLLASVWQCDVRPDRILRYFSLSGVLTDAAGQVDLSADSEGVSEFEALRGTRFSPPDAVKFSDFVSADDGLSWEATDPEPGSRAAGQVKTEPGVKVKAEVPTTQQALLAVAVLKQYLKLREAEKDMEDYISYVSLTEKKLQLIQMAETGAAGTRVKKEPRVVTSQISQEVVTSEQFVLSGAETSSTDSKDDGASSVAEVKESKQEDAKMLVPRKGGIRVGPQFQAEVPSQTLDGKSDGTVEDTERPPGELMWSPDHKLTDTQINHYITIARAIGMFARACEGLKGTERMGIYVAASNASRDATRSHALHVLHRHQYQVGRALMALVPSGRPVLCRDELEDWSPSEAHIFEQAIQTHGKLFHTIRTQHLPWKTAAQITEYYYMWKTTDRYSARRRAKYLRIQQRVLDKQPAPDQSETAAESADQSALGAEPAGQSALTVEPAGQSESDSGGQRGLANGARPAGPQGANDALSVLSPILSALGTSVSIEPVAAGGKRPADDQRNKSPTLEKLCGGVRLSGECSITPVPLGR